MTNLVKDHQKDFRWLTKDMVNSAYTRYKKRRRLEENSGKEQPTMLQIQLDEKNSSLHTSMSDLTTETVDTNSRNNDTDNCVVVTTTSVKSVETRDKGGRPVGTTQSQKRRREDMIVSMKNEIAQQYEEELSSHKKRGKRLKSGRLKYIIDTHKSK